MTLHLLSKGQFIIYKECFYNSKLTNCLTQSPPKQMSRLRQVSRLGTLARLMNTPRGTNLTNYSNYRRQRTRR